MKRLTKIASLLLAAILLLGAAALPAHAEEDVVGGEIFGSALTWQFQKSTNTLTISGSGEMPNNPCTDKTWAKYRTGEKIFIQTIVIEEGVTSLGVNALEGCKKATDISIPASVQLIANGAFSGCESLPKIVLPEGITKISQSTFYECKSLTEVVLPESLTKILPLAFYQCSSLNAPVFPASLTAIEDYAFSGATAMKEINLPAGVEVLSPTAFNHCTGLTAYHVAEGNRYYTDVDGVLFNADKTVLTAYPAARTESSYTVPDGVLEIRDYAFSYAGSLTEIRLPEGLEKLGGDAFKACTALGNLTLPKTLKQIGAGAFYGCDAMTELVLPASVERLGGGIALACKNLAKATVLNPDCVFDGTYTFEKGVTVYGYVGSTADRYATRNGNRFEPLDKFTQFEDVASGTWYYNAVVWAFKNGITSGTRESAFSPSAPCTRAQVVTFLWRAAGCPAPESQANPFRDVEEGSYYGQAVLWAAENGITTGVGEGLFGPNATCTRGQIVTFLWRYEGEPEAKSSHSAFADVKPGTYYHTAVLWAAENGITEGVSETEFAPGNTCARGQIVTFLYRDAIR